MPRKARYHDVRKGVTGESIVNEDFNFLVQLHVYLRTWDVVFKLIARLNCITEINVSTGDKVEIADIIGHGGTSTTGPVWSESSRADWPSA